MRNSIKVSPKVRGIATLAACTLALAGLGSASSARASNLWVTSLTDHGPGSLRKAIAGAAPAGDTIKFRVAGTIILTSGALTIDKSLDIEGPGPNKLKISGNHARRVFVIQSGTVTIAGVTITDGLADGSSPMIPSIGGGILNLAPASLTLSDDIVSDNKAIGDASQMPLGACAGLAAGGGVANLGTLTVTASSFLGNLARGGDRSSSIATGGGGEGVGGGIYSTGNVLTVLGSSFSHNQAVGGNDCLSIAFTGLGNGGAIYSLGPLLVVRDSEFYFNKAIGGNGNEDTSPVTGGGGGSAPNAALGGGIGVPNGTGTIERCTLEHNQAIAGAGSSVANRRLGGLGSGGAMHVCSLGSSTGATVTISNSKVEHNTALGGPGGPGGDGGVGSGGGLTCVSATLNVISTTVAYNRAQGAEGGAGGRGGDSVGGGLYDWYYVPPLCYSTLTLKGATVSCNLAVGGEAKDGGGEGEGTGGGVYNEVYNQLTGYSADSTTIFKKNQAYNNNVYP